MKSRRTPFHGGFGLLNLQGIAKPTDRAFEPLHKLGPERLLVDGCTVNARFAPSLRTSRRVASPPPSYRDCDEQAILREPVRPYTDILIRVG